MQGQYVPYAVIPDCGDSTSSLSETVSHELAESVSDTDDGVSPAWTGSAGDGALVPRPDYACPNQNNCPSNCGEIGDVCDNSGKATVPGTSVTAQVIWSQLQNGCFVEDTNVQVGRPGPPRPSRLARRRPAWTLEQAPASGSPDAGGSSSGGDAGHGGSDAGSSGGRATGGSSGGFGVDAGREGGGVAISPEGGSGDAGGASFDTGGSAGGCGCKVASRDGSSGSGGVVGALLAVAALARARRSRRDRFRAR